jgi:hypothetical protein
MEIARRCVLMITREEVEDIAKISALKTLTPVKADVSLLQGRAGSSTKPNTPSQMTARQSFPFQIMVKYSDDTSSATVSVYIRHGAFVLNDSDGTHRFVATNTLDDEAGYTIFSTPEGVAADKTIWAKLDMSSTEPVATIEDEQPDDDPEVFYVCIGKVNAYGGIEQYVFGHIPHGGGSGVDYSKFAFGYKLVSIAGDTEEDPSTPGVEITPGSVRMHGLRVYTMAEAEIVALTGTPCIVTLVVDRTATAPASITFEVSSVVADSTSTSLRIPLYSFKQMGDSYALELIYSLGDINFDQPIR